MAGQPQQLRIEHRGSSHKPAGDGLQVVEQDVGGGAAKQLETTGQAMREHRDALIGEEPHILPSAPAERVVPIERL
jgi:hypothetical protein